MLTLHSSLCLCASLIVCWVVCCIVSVWDWSDDKLLLHKALRRRSISSGGYPRTHRNTPLRQADGDLVCVCLIRRYLCLLHNHSPPPSFSSTLFFLSFLPTLFYKRVGRNESFLREFSKRTLFSTLVSQLVLSRCPPTGARSLMSVCLRLTCPLLCLPRMWWIAFNWENSFAFITCAEGFDKVIFFLPLSINKLGFVLLWTNMQPK